MKIIKKNLLTIFVVVAASITGFLNACKKSNPAILPTLTTTTASSITASTSQSGGDITSDGGGSISAKGVCWDTAINPTIALNTKTTDGYSAGNFSNHHNVIRSQPRTIKNQPPHSKNHLHLYE